VVNKKNKILLIVSGESFRSGGQFSRVTGLEESIDNQIQAACSHVEFIQYLKNKYNIDTDIQLLTYSTPHNQILIQLYESNLLKYNFYNMYFSDRTALTNSEKIPEINDKYDSILVIRPDIFLKDFFIKNFNPFSEKICYPSMTWMTGSYYTIKDKIIAPRVNDMMIFVPNEFFNQIYYEIGLKTYHEGIRDYLGHGIPVSKFDFMVKTLHDSDSAKDYNPLYRLVSRPESKKWLSYGYLINENFKPYETRVKLYDFLDWNIFENTEEIKSQYSMVKNIDNIWEWWDNSESMVFYPHSKFNKFINIIELDFSLEENVLHIVNPTRYPAETYWNFDKTKISFFDPYKNKTSIFYKITDELYEGESFIQNRSFLLKKK
jgi:hypothetical protein